LIGRDHRDDDDERRQRGRFEADGETLDHVGAVARHRSLGDRLDRAVVGAGVIFGDPHQQAGGGDADHHADEQAPAGELRAGDQALRRLGGDMVARLEEAARIDRQAADHCVHVAQRILGDEPDCRDRKQYRGPEALV
ncbi:hypothetical protein QU38_00945, partial [Staphylococcus aureus]